MDKQGEIQGAILSQQIKGLQDQFDRTDKKAETRFTTLETKLDKILDHIDSRFAHKSTVEDMRKDIDTIDTRIWGLIVSTIFSLIGMLTSIALNFLR